MDRIGIKDINQQTSAVIARVRDDGEALIITERGRPVAMLIPYVDSTYDTMVKLGSVRIPSTDGLLNLERQRIGAPSSDILAALSGDSV